jgi:nucleoside phosphorylase
VLYGWLRGTIWVRQAEGYEFIQLPFAASAELWRRLLYGTTADGRVEVAPYPLSREQQLPDVVEDLPTYKAEEQSWWTPLPPMKDLRSGKLTALANEIDIVLITATDRELEAVLRRLEPYPRRKAVLKGFAEQETYYLGKFGACLAAVTKCRMGSLDSGGATLATEHAQRVWRPRAIVMAGVALGKDPKKQRIADVLVGSQVISYEPQRVGKDQIVSRGPIPPAHPTLLNRFDMVPNWSFCRPDGSKCKREVGPILSGEKLVDDAEFKASLLERYPQAIGGDMEGVGLSAAAIRHGVPWILVKAICDFADGNKHDKHQSLAATAAVSLVHHVLSQPDVLHGLHKLNQTC